MSQRFCFHYSEGNSIRETNWENLKNNSRWHLLNSDELRLNTLYKKLSLTLNSKPELIVTELSKITGQSITTNSTLKLVYKFKDYLCNSQDPKDEWNKRCVKSRKKFLEPYWATWNKIQI